METWRLQLYSDELYHHGIMGMKWGSRNGPPYPLRPGARSSAEKKQGSPIAEKFADFRKKAKRKAATMKARATKKKNARFEKKRQEALRKGSATDVLKYRGHLSNEEMERAYKRIEWENKLTDLSQKEISRGQARMDKLLGKNGLGMVKEWSGNLSGVIKNYQEIDKLLNPDTKAKERERTKQQLELEKMRLDNELKKVTIQSKKQSHEDDDDDEKVKHSGIKGQRWHARRFRNYDGTLTPAGKERYYGSGTVAITMEDDGSILIGSDDGREPIRINPDDPKYEEYKAEYESVKEKEEKLQRAIRHAYAGAWLHGMTYSEELFHYGVKGMKWRHRKNKNKYSQDTSGNTYSTFRNDPKNKAVAGGTTYDSWRSRVRSGTTRLPGFKRASSILERYGHDYAASKKQNKSRKKQGKMAARKIVGD